MTREQAINYLISSGFSEEQVGEVVRALTYEPTTKNDLGVLDKLRAEIEPKCDRINSLASVLPYTAHREIQELLCEIMDLCKAESEDKEDKKP